MIPTGTGDPLHEIVYVDETIYISSAQGHLFKSTDKCTTLTSLVPPNPVQYYYQNNLNVLDTNTLFVSSYRSQPNQGFVFKSADGGTTWDTIADLTGSLFSSFIMFDTLSGVVLQTPYDGYFTTNEGLNWTSFFHGLDVPRHPFKLNDSTALIATSDNIAVSYDKGQSWSGFGFVGSTAQDICAFGADSIFTVTVNANGCKFAYKLTPGLGGWQYAWLTDIVPWAVYAKSTNEVYIAGQQISSGNACIMSSSDLGSTWQVYDFGISGEIYDMVFIDDSTAIVCGLNGFLAKWNSNSPMGWLSTSYPTINGNFSLYPNPARNKLIVTYDQNVPGLLEIIDMMGAILKTVELTTMSTEIDVSDLPMGIYLVKIKGTEHISRLVKQ